MTLEKKFENKALHWILQTIKDSLKVNTFLVIMRIDRIIRFPSLDYPIKSCNDNLSKNLRSI